MTTISQEAALKIILNMGKPLPIETVNIDSCLDRTLAKDLTSNVFSPPAHVSAMDGYGVNANNYDNVYRLVGEVSAGKKFKKKILEGQAVRIFTGAVIPEGVNKVIPQEYLISMDRTSLKFSTSEENFIRYRGSNFMQGFTVKQGTFLSPKIISLLAAMNKKSIPVYRNANVAILSIGSELSYPGLRLPNNKISSSNCYGIKALLENFNSNVYLNPILADDVTVIAQAIKSLLSYDVIITIGGASVGKYDFVHDAAMQAGVKFKFCKVNMRPGKPFKAGKVGKTLLFSLPGNPVSALICSQLFITPLLKKFQGNKTKVTIKEGILSKNLSKNGPRKHFMRAQSFFRNGERYVMPSKNQDSHNLVVLEKSNALIIRPENDNKKKVGEKVKFLKLKI